ncbi:MAG: hypothetical protein JJE29_00020 [Peptostreptococcaceae bacterium]|nr:hypothetical protein [Peptostreptococcaceae bacterium]
MSLKMDLRVFEAMIFFWTATMEREKVGERYLNDIADMEDMKSLYDDEFNKESVRKILSAISNREMFRPANKKEGSFWNYNMWIMEDPEVMKMIIETVKSIEVKAVEEKISGKQDEIIEIAFIPGHGNPFYTIGGKLLINVFMFRYDFNADKIKYIEKPIEDYIAETIMEKM